MLSIAYRFASSFALLWKRGILLSGIDVDIQHRAIARMHRTTVCGLGAWGYGHDSYVMK